MTCVVAGITIEELIGYFAAIGGVKDAVNYIQEAATDVTHAYNKGKEVVNTTKYRYEQKCTQIESTQKLVKARYNKYAVNKKKNVSKATRQKYAYKHSRSYKYGKK